MRVVKNDPGISYRGPSLLAERKRRGLLIAASILAARSKKVGGGVKQNPIGQYHSKNQSILGLLSPSRTSPVWPQRQGKLPSSASSPEALQSTGDACSWRL